jgi:hypothetical protein
MLGKWKTTDTLADLNQDGLVNVLDLSRLLAKWGPVATGNCTVSDKLVNSCRPWLGAAVSYYPNIGGSNPYDPTVQFPYFNKRLNDPNVLLDVNKQVNVVYKTDFVHYYTSGAKTLSSFEKSIINSSDQYLQLNYKPNSVFREGDGRNATVNGYIDGLANSIKTVAPKKVMLVIYHEPENDVTPGTTSCSTSDKGTSGSPAEYRAMWANVRARFDALGVNNVVWVMNYMGFSNYDCLVKELWPGNQYVDWIHWDPYDGGTVNYLSTMKRFYDWMETNSTSQYDFTSKIWGLGEFGYWNKDNNSTDANALIFWQQAKQSIINNDMPRVKLYSVFDSSADSTPGDASLVGVKFTDSTTLEPSVEKQSAFNEFAQTLLSYRY